MIDLLISSTVLIVAVIALRWLFKNRISRRLQYALWLIVAIRLVLPIQLGTSPISIDRMDTEKLETAITNTVREPVTGPSYTVIYSQVAEEFASAEQNIETPVIRNEIEAETARRITVPTLGEIANAVWIVGATVMAAWFLFVNLRFRRTLRKDAAEIAVPGCDVPVKVCPALTSPCLSGLFRPTVYLTESCTDDPQRLRHILAHELTHLRHGDLFWSALRSILLCLYWFHPLVWMAAILSKRDCELACDEGALAKLGEAERIAYGKTLLDTVARRPSPNHLLETATSMNETKKQLKERVNFIVKKPKFYLILTVCVLLITAVAIGCTFTGAPEPTVTPAETTAPVETTSPTETTVPTDPRLFNDEQLAELQTIFTGYIGMRTNWYNAALLATFDSPEELDAYDLFSVGTGNPEDEQLTDEELVYLSNTDLAPWIENTCRMSSAYVENVLDVYFGLTPDDLHTGYKQFIYWDKTDCYYFLTEPPHVIDFHLLGARRQEDGTILFEYYDPYTNQPNIFEAVIRPTASGYRMVSNRIVEKSSLNPDAKLETLVITGEVDLIKKLETLFANPQTADTIYYNWYNDCLRAHLSCPEDLDLAKIFCGRTGIPNARQLTDAENAYLQDFYSMYIAIYNNKPIQRIPRETVEQVLHLYYGFSSEDVHMESSDMVYWEETDCYYVIVDSEGIGQTKVLRVDVLSDNSIRMLYTDPTDTYRDTVYEAVLRPALGGYQILSNLPVVDREIMENCPLSPSPRPNPMNILNMVTTRRDGAFNFALKSAYEDPADVDIYELFYSMPKDDTPSDAEIEFAISKGLDPEICPIYRYPVSTIDSVLRRVFGIGFDECNGIGLEHFVYNKKTNCYYESHGDFMDASYNPKHMVQLLDGSVQIYYSGLVNYEFRDMVVTLVPTETSWHIVSNVPAEKAKTYTDTSWRPTAENTPLSYEDYFSKKREFTDSQAIYEKRWRITKNGALADIQNTTDGYALLHDENGFFIVSFENYGGGDWSIGTRKGGWYQYGDDARALEVIWQVPYTDGIKDVDHYLTDGRYVYYIQYKKFIYQVDLLTGQRYLTFKADRICVESNHCMILYDQSVLIFLNQAKNTVSINRVYLPTGRNDVLYDQIPLEQIHSGSNMHCTDSDTICWTIMEPNFLNRLWEIVRDPNSSYYNKSGNETVLYHELFGGANSIMKSTTWKELSGHAEFIELAQIIETHEEIPSLLDCSYNTRTGEYSETPYYWDTHMNE